jgi:FkbM family methyltransferase
MTAWSEFVGLRQGSKIGIGMIRRVLGRAANRSVRWWAVHKNGTIRRGAGAGLKFNTRYASADYLAGTNETPVQRAIAQHLVKGKTFYDIGANIGFFSVLAARLVGESGLVYSFEPVPENAAAIRRNARLNGFNNVTVLEQAVSVSSGSANMLLTGHPGGAQLDTARGFLVTPSRQIIVPTVSIDGLLAEGSIKPPDVVKLDVEGVELDALRGMSGTLKSIKPIVVFEIDDRDYEPFMQKNREIDAFLCDCGYDVSTLETSYPGLKWHVRHGIAKFEDRALRADSTSKIEDGKGRA